MNIRQSIGEAIPPIIIKKIAENYKLPYFTITPTFSICPKHGYLPGEHKYCPKCDKEIGFEEDVKKKEVIAHSGANKTEKKASK